MPELPLLLVLIVAVALLFDFTNGAHDSANAIATVVSAVRFPGRISAHGTDQDRVLAF